MGVGGRCLGIQSNPKPTYIPFFGHFAPSPASPTIIDDGRRPTFLSTIADAAFGLFKKKKPVTEDTFDFEGYEDIDPIPEIYVPDEKIIELQVSIPPEYQTSHEVMEQFIQALRFAKYPVSFEIIATKERVYVQYACRSPDEHQLHNQLLAYVPDALVTPTRDFLETSWGEITSSPMVIIDFGRSDECMYSASAVPKLPG